MTVANTEILEILRNLIGFASVSVRSNLDIIDYIETYLERCGVASSRIPNTTGDKASLLATIGPADRPGVVLSAHTDVVPADECSWASPPFVATKRDNRVIGRGVADMKGFIAVVLAHVKLFTRAATATPVHLAFSYDEELGCRGAPDLVRAVADLSHLPALCIVGEPTGLAVVNAHKGKVVRRVTIMGPGGHSAYVHRAANTVLAVARLAQELDAIANRIMVPSSQHPEFDPPWPSLHVGSIHGGSKVNLVPARAVLEFEIRGLPDTDLSALHTEIDDRISDIREDLRGKAADAAITVEEIAAYPPLMLPAGNPAIAAVARLANCPLAGSRAVSFGTEGGLYAAAGIPTLVCGPGDIARAHKANEWIGLDELDQAAEMMARLAARLGQPVEDWVNP